MASASNRPTMILNAIRTMFARLGTADGPKAMQPPQLHGNRGAVAWEYYTARELERLAKERKAVATAAALEAGVIFDTGKEPREPGYNGVVYNDPVVQVLVRVSKAATKLDEKQFIIELEKRGVKPDIIKSAQRDATKQTKAAHYFSAVLVGGASDSVDEAEDAA